MKCAFDIIAASVGLVLLAPLLLVVSLLIKLDSPGPVLFRQERMGRGFQSFRIYKFRTIGGDPRITRLGRVLRTTKIDELPQLINVLRGEMSFVGPRPEVRRYVELFREDYAEILKVLPGITDLASLQFRYEAELLGRCKDPEEEYVKRVLPEKIRLAREYISRSSFGFDVTLILKTVLRVLR
jgi:lipopolysaccharide/colanic/teichoic acid biosynthesis glycosyltransferase